MTPEQTLAFLAFSVVVAGTPGPSNTLLTAVGANVGVVRGLPGVAGVACGMAALNWSALRPNSARVGIAPPVPGSGNQRRW